MILSEAGAGHDRGEGVMIQVAETVRMIYPGTHAGFLAMSGVSNPGEAPALEAEKAALEQALRARLGGLDRPALEAYGLLPAYAAYYKAFGKTYHVRGQLESVVLKGRALPRVAALVEAMFMAELKNLVLTAGHDRDALNGTVCVNVATGTETYTTMRGQDQVLKADDLYMTDAAGVISSILYGPDKRTAITSATTRVLFACYAPPGVPVDAVNGHLADIRDYVLLVSPGARIERLEVLG